jgi:isopenicillin-N epimerase
MAILPLPNNVDGLLLKTRLYDEHRIEIPFTKWEEQSFLRISIQSYNDENDVDKLADALKILLA